MRDLRAVWCGDIYASVAAREVKVTAADKMHALYEKMETYQSKSLYSANKLRWVRDIYGHPQRPLSSLSLSSPCLSISCSLHFRSHFNTLIIE